MINGAEDAYRQSILSRVNLEEPLAELVARVSQAFALSSPCTFELILTGYQDLNLKLTAQSGQQYVLKIFSKLRSQQNIADQVNALVTLYAQNIPVPRLLRAAEGPLFKIGTDGASSFACIVEYFPGNSFEQDGPSESDIAHICGCLSQMHQLPLKVSRFYDEWGAANLNQEWQAKRRYAAPEDLTLIKSIAALMRTVNLSKFRQATIHGDLYRAHVLKTQFQKYCIIDFGCMDYNAAVLDLAIFIAHFCLDASLSDNQTRHIYELALNEYRIIGSLTEAELLAVPILIAASHAAYILATSALIAQKQRYSDPPEKWLALSRDKLKAFIRSGLLPEL